MAGFASRMAAADAALAAKRGSDIAGADADAAGVLHAQSAAARAALDALNATVESDLRALEARLRAVRRLQLQNDGEQYDAILGLRRGAAAADGAAVAAGTTLRAAVASGEAEARTGWAGVGAAQATERADMLKQVASGESAADTSQRAVLAADRAAIWQRTQGKMAALQAAISALAADNAKETAALQTRSAAISAAEVVQDRDFDAQLATIQVNQTRAWAEARRRTAAQLVALGVAQGRIAGDGTREGVRQTRDTAALQKAVKDANAAVSASLAAKVDADDTALAGKVDAAMAALEAEAEALRKGSEETFARLTGEREAWAAEQATTDSGDNARLDALARIASAGTQRLSALAATVRAALTAADDRLTAGETSAEALQAKTAEEVNGTLVGAVALVRATGAAAVEKQAADSDADVKGQAMALGQRVDALEAALREANASIGSFVAALRAREEAGSTERAAQIAAAQAAAAASARAIADNVSDIRSRIAAARSAALATLARNAAGGAAAAVAQRVAAADAIASTASNASAAVAAASTADHASLAARAAGWDAQLKALAAQAETAEGALATAVEQARATATADHQSVVAALGMLSDTLDTDARLGAAAVQSLRDGLSEQDTAREVAEQNLTAVAADARLRAGLRGEEDAFAAAMGGAADRVREELARAMTAAGALVEELSRQVRRRDGGGPGGGGVGGD
jgi:trimeric autotransporter adhesin